MSGATRILARLRQGPATAAELYALHCVVHSRISELRKQGHRIVCERTPGETGPEAYVYRLVGESLREREGVEGGIPSTSGAKDTAASRAPSRSLSDLLTDRGRGATAATAIPFHDPSLGDGEDGLSTGAPHSSGPDPQSSEGFALSGSAVVGRPSGSEQLSLDVAA